MNIIEAKDVLSRINAEYNVYCQIASDSDMWIKVDKTVGELAEQIANADSVKTIVMQEGSKCYEPIYAQVFDGHKLVALICRDVKVENVNYYYIIPLGASVAIETVLPKIGQIDKRGGGMGGFGTGRK